MALFIIFNEAIAVVSSDNQSKDYFDQYSESLESFTCECLLKTEGKFDAKVHCSPVCKRAGIECQNNVVWKMNWRYHSPSVRSFDWLPPTLRKAQFSDRSTRKWLHSRYLPRMLSFLDVYNCDVFGSIDMQCLPRPMEFFGVRHNRVSGAIFLHCLPEKLEIIELNENPILLCVVDNYSIPESLKTVIFSKKTKVQSVGRNDPQINVTYAAVSVRVRDKMYNG